MVDNKYHEMECVLLWT